MNARRAVLVIGHILVMGSLALPLIDSAVAQTAGGVVVGSGPGTAGAARLVTTSATVTAVDMTTRTVTLRRADGTTFNVVAGAEVRNLAQLRPGDTVSVDFYDSLALELKKGGTGAPASRADVVTGGRAALGERPGGGVAREVIIVADVIAVNTAAQTVTVRGPEGRTVDLSVRDPEQFRRIAVGDQVQATYVEAAALSITPAPAAAPVAVAPVAAPVVAPWGRWMLGARVININPDVSSSIGGFDVQDQWTGEFDATYFFTRNVAIEGSITWAKQDVSFRGEGLGSLKMMPLVFTLQYHFDGLAGETSPLRAFKPYVGGGFNYTYFYETDLGSAARASVKRDSWGGALQAGVDFMVQRNWYLNLDVKYLWMDNEVRIDSLGITPTTLDLDPWVFGVGVRYRF